jgi:hypothetical protein
MSNKLKPLLVGAVFFAAAALVAVFALRKAGVGPASSGPLAETAESVHRDVETQLRAQQASLVAKARAAAALPRLRAALASNVDAPTIVDLFASEGWWRPIRDEFKISRLVTATEVATFGQFDTKGDDGPLIVTARKEGSASAFLVVKSQPYLAAAVRLGNASDGATVLLLAKACDNSWLGDIAGETKAGVMLTDDQSQLMAAGAAPLRSYLQAIGPRTPGPSVADGQGRWAGAVFELGQGLRLWAVREVAGGGGGLESALWVWWTGAGGLALVGLIVAGRRRPAPSFNPVLDNMASMAPVAPIVPPATNGIAPHPPLGLAPKPAPAPVPIPTAGNGFSADLVPTGGPARALAAVPPSSNGSLEGKTFGRYRLVKKIADGGMSEIYRAVAFGPEGFSRSFVVKRLKPELAHQKEAVAQFIDEARVQASLVHSNVVPVFDFGTMNDDYYMTEEYIAGRDVMQFSHRCVEDTRYPMDPRIAYYIAHETLQALHYAHTRSNAAGEALDIVHRDVSSMNIMVAASGDVKLVDFGIAKANTRVSRTHHGIIKGNAHFMSPEHARGQVVDARSDVFCVGLVLYFCLTNQMLYTGNNDLEVLYRAAHGPTQVELEMIDMLDAPAPDILHRALAIDPSQRFQSAGQFAAALAPYIAGAKAVTADLVVALFGDELKAEMA